MRGGRRFTTEAMVAGLLIALIPGFIVGVAIGLLVQSWELGAIFGAGVFLLGLDVCFRGTHD